jgi:ribose transport system ATP-binding protein
MVSMARALSQDARLIIMDEPSAVLDNEEVERLFVVIRDLTAQGVAVVYISHRLEEIRQIGDRITVLKDGSTVATGLAVDQTPTSELIKLMTGRSIEYVFPPRGEVVEATGDPVLEVTGLELPGVFTGVDLSVRAGEIVGLAGLVGAAARRSSRPSTARGVRRRAPCGSRARSCVAAPCRPRSRPASGSPPRSARARVSCSTRPSTPTSPCPR